MDEGARDPDRVILDLRHQGRPNSIASCLLPGGDGFLLVDPGPASTLPVLERELSARGLGLEDLTGLLLTHIHLDHAGASGTLARANPRLRIHVHSKGAAHLIDPSKLIGSARRLYGDRMDQLWGEIAPVPAPQVVPLEGGERLALGGRAIEVRYTPGHAWHHVSYLDRETRTVFVGDTGGLRSPDLPVVLPVTPPPDFDLEAWLESLDRLLHWEPRELLLTHFGAFDDPAFHIEELREGLVSWTGYVAETLEVDGADEGRVSRFVEKLRKWLAARAPADRIEQYLAGAGPEACWIGIARYLRKR